MNRMIRAFRILWLLIKELSDESPYRRHLTRHELSHSPEEWRRFLDDYFQRKYSRPKCC